MTKLKGVLLGTFLTLSSTVSSQHIDRQEDRHGVYVDSLTEVPVPKYVLYRIFHDLEAFKICDSLQRVQAEHIGMAVETLTVMDSIIRLQRSEIIYLDKEIKLTNDRIEAQQEINKAMKNERNRWKMGAIIGGALIVLITIL